MEIEINNDINAEYVSDSLYMILLQLREIIIPLKLRFISTVSLSPAPPGSGSGSGRSSGSISGSSNSTFSCPPSPPSITKWRQGRRSWSIFVQLA